MENLEIFDKNGKVLCIADVIINYLKNNLEIQLSTNIEGDYDDRYTTIEVSILLDKKVICKSSDNLK
jgi:hypothetical protein